MTTSRAARRQEIERFTRWSDDHRPRRQSRVSVAINTLALIGGLVVIVTGQLVLLPFVFTKFIDDPVNFHTTQQHQTLSEFAADARQRQPRRQPVLLPNQPSDGTFNGVPIYLKTATNVRSKVHCVGENYLDNAWKHRSCHFDLICFNTTAKDFVVYQSDNERILSAYMTQRVHMHSSSNMMRFGANRSNTVAIGGLNQKWGDEGMARLEWFPKIIYRNASHPLTYYQLPENMVLLPFHSLNGANPGHLVWDDFLALYTLLTMFQLEDRPLLPMRYSLQDGERGLWASCDLRPEKREECEHMFRKFLPLLLGPNVPYQFTTNENFVFAPSSTEQSELVCAKTGAAGLGPLTDHGIHKSHGWEDTDYLLTHNSGRGGLLYNFRNFMLDNLGIDVAYKPQKPHRVVFSTRSSDIGLRSLDFGIQAKVVQKYFPNERVENYTMKELSLQEQLAVASQTSIYVTLCGGGAVTAMFLPRGATVIVYYSETGGFKGNVLSGTPALLDWDLFNSMSHLRVHWMPRDSMGDKLDVKSLVLLIQQELEIMNGGAFV